MSQPDADQTVTAAAEHAAATAVVDHHAQLAAGLNERVEALIGSVDTGQLPTAETARREVVAFVGREILPHARAEEQALYPPAAARPEGRLLVDGMLAEHRALTALADEVGQHGSLVRAAAAARALAALFAVHLAKENDLVLPLLTATPGVSLARLLDGMHDLLGADEGTPATGGCGGACGCGGDAAQSAAPAAAPVLSVDDRLDVRDVPHGQRHALVLSTVAALQPGQALVLVAGHAPAPVLAELDHQFGGQVQAQWLQSGPEVWQVRLERVAAHV
jgi:uncharacterized protein (DUF2249 family)